MMKKILSFLLLCALVFGMLPTLPMAASAVAGDVKLAEENFPDANFLKYLKETFDTTANGGTAGDGILTADEIGKITEITLNTYDGSSPSIMGMGIKDLTGIENFTLLTHLDCWGNNLTNLNMSKNTALTYLECGANQLTSLDVRGNTELTYLSCSGNQLTSLDVSKNTALTDLYCSSNQLTNLDVSKNTALTELRCDGNKLSELDVSNNTALRTLGCYGNKLSELNVSNNPVLEMLDCGANQLTSLDVRKSTSLTYLSCIKNKLTSLDVSNNAALIDLSCYGNQLSNLDLSKNKKLFSLDVGDDGIKKYDLSQNPALHSLSIHQKMDLAEQADGTWQVDLNKLNDIASLPNGWIDLSKVVAEKIYDFGEDNIPDAEYDSSTGIITLQSKDNLYENCLNIYENKENNPKQLSLYLNIVPYGGATPAPIPTPNPPPPPPPLPITGGYPTIIEGANSVWTAENPNDVVIVSNIPYGMFEALMIGGNIVDPSYYSIKGDSITVTISTKYLKTLKLGEYEVKLVTVDGEAKGVLRIKALGDDTEVPLYILLFAASAFIVMTGTAITKKYNGTF